MKTTSKSVPPASDPVDPGATAAPAVTPAPALVSPEFAQTLRGFLQSQPEARTKLQELLLKDAANLIPVAMEAFAQSVEANKVLLEFKNTVEQDNLVTACYFEPVDDQDSQGRPLHRVFVAGERPVVMPAGKGDLEALALGDEVLVGGVGPKRYIRCRTGSPWIPRSAQLANLVGISKEDPSFGRVTYRGESVPCRVSSRVTAALTSPEDFPAEVNFDPENSVVTDLALEIPARVPPEDVLADAPRLEDLPGLGETLQLPLKMAVGRLAMAKLNREIFRRCPQVMRFLDVKKCVLLMAGPLGVGKTSFIRALCEILSDIQRAITAERRVLLTAARAMFTASGKKESLDPLQAARGVVESMQRTLDMITPVIPGLTLPESPTDAESVPGWLESLVVGAGYSMKPRLIAHALKEVEASIEQKRDGILLEIMTAADAFKPFVGQAVGDLQAKCRRLRKSLTFGVLYCVEAEAYLKRRDRVVSTDCHQEIVTLMNDICYGSLSTGNLLVLIDTNLLDMFDGSIIDRSTVFRFTRPAAEHIPAIIEVHLKRKLDGCYSPGLSRPLADYLLGDQPILHVVGPKGRVSLPARPFLTPRLIATIVDSAGLDHLDRQSPMHPRDLLSSACRELYRMASSVTLETLPGYLIDLSPGGIPAAVGRCLEMVRRREVQGFQVALDLEAELERIQGGATA